MLETRRLPPPTSQPVQKAVIGERAETQPRGRAAVMAEGLQPMELAVLHRHTHAESDGGVDRKAFPDPQSDAAPHFQALYGHVGEDGLCHRGQSSMLARVQVLQAACQDMVGVDHRASSPRSGARSPWYPLGCWCNAASGRVLGAFLAIRAASESDLGAILEIYNHAVMNTTATFDLAPRTAETQAAWLLEHVPPYPAIVWEEDGQVLGWGSISPFATRPAYRFSGELSVYVSSDARRRGIGASLLRELVRLGAVNGLHSLLGRIAEENSASVALAEKTGFRRVGLLEEVGFKFDRWLNVAIYQRGCGT